MRKRIISLQLIGFPGTPSVKVDDERKAFGMAAVAAQCDMLMVDDDISWLPVFWFI